MHTRTKTSSWQRSPVLRGAGKRRNPLLYSFSRFAFEATAMLAEETSTMLILFLVVKVQCCKDFPP